MRFYDPGIGRFITRDMLAQAVALGKVSQDAVLTRGVRMATNTHAQGKWRSSFAAHYVAKVTYQEEQQDAAWALAFPRRAGWSGTVISDLPFRPANPYDYVESGPVRGVDPSGLVTQLCTSGVEIPVPSMFVRYMPRPGLTYPGFLRGWVCQCREDDKNYHEFWLVGCLPVSLVATTQAIMKRANLAQAMAAKVQQEASATERMWRQTIDTVCKKVAGWMEKWEEIPYGKGEAGARKCMDAAKNLHTFLVDRQFEPYYRADRKAAGME